MKKVDLNIKLTKKETELDVTPAGVPMMKDKVGADGKVVKDAKGNVVQEPIRREVPEFESALKWIENSIIRVMNGTTIDRKPTKQPKLTEKAKWRSLSNALENHNKGIVILEETDYKFLNDNFHKVEQIADTRIDEILLAISDAIKGAEDYKPKLEVIEKKDDKTEN